MEWIDIISLLLAPITGIVGWFAGGLKRRNDNIALLQETIDNLMIKNNDLYSEILKLRSRINELEYENKRIKLLIDKETKK